VRVALVEDHSRMAELVAAAMARVGIAVDTYATCGAARHWLPRMPYGAAIVDRGLPDGDGLAMLSGLRRAEWRVPCLVLTARDAIHDRVEGLEQGADDYLPKPFAMDELLARVRALLRRRPMPVPLVFEIGGLRIDAQAATVHARGVPIHVSATEFRLLLALAEAGSAPCAPAHLIDAAYGPFAETTRNGLDVALHRLRRKLQAAGACAGIVNHRGIGHALAPVESG
jgi:DNA-binding response OmpR family regulator